MQKENIEVSADASQSETKENIVVQTTSQSEKATLSAPPAAFKASAEAVLQKDYALPRLSCALRDANFSAWGTAQVDGILEQRSTIDQLHESFQTLRAKYETSTAMSGYFAIANAILILEKLPRTWRTSRADLVDLFAVLEKPEIVAAEAEKVMAFVQQCRQAYVDAHPDDFKEPNDAVRYKSEPLTSADISGYLSAQGGNAAAQSLHLFYSKQNDGADPVPEAQSLQSQRVTPLPAAIEDGEQKGISSSFEANSSNAKRVEEVNYPRGAAGGPCEGECRPRDGCTSATLLRLGFGLCLPEGPQDESGYIEVIQGPTPPIATSVFTPYDGNRVPQVSSASTFRVECFLPQHAILSPEQWAQMRAPGPSGTPPVFVVDVQDHFVVAVPMVIAPSQGKRSGAALLIVSTTRASFLHSPALAYVFDMVVGALKRQASKPNGTSKPLSNV